MGRYLTTKEGNRMKGTSGAKKTSTKKTSDEEEITSTSVEPTSAEKPVEETKSPAEQVAETATSTGNNQPTTENGDTDYTIDDVISVAETGSLPPVEPRSAYDMYMEEAKNIYNQGVEANNKNAANQAASAGAQYREVLRNVGEINKINGSSNTGYEGDTIINAYNAYRNSVNDSYDSANKSNNELYAYYLNEMRNIQQQKDNKDAIDRDFDMRENEYNDQKNTSALVEVENIIANDGVNYDGTLKTETINKVWDYLASIYGSRDAIPSDVIARINTYPGFSNINNENASANNSGSYITDTEINNINSYDDYLNVLGKLDSNKGSFTTEEYNRLKSKINEKCPYHLAKGWELTGYGTGKTGDTFDLYMNGTKYDLKCGDSVTDETTIKTLNLIATGYQDQYPSTAGDSFVGNWSDATGTSHPGKILVYNNKMYFYGLKGWKIVTYDGGNSQVLTNAINNYKKQG